MTWRCILIISCFIYYVYGEELFSGPRIVGGKLVEDRSYFAYQVSLRIRNKHFCGGTIIDEQHILTAAHCCFDLDHDVLKASRIEVYAGDLRLSQTLPSTQKRTAKYIFTHSDYDHKTIANDIALIRVKKNFTFNENVKALELSSEAPKEGENCVISGWGQMHQDSGKLSEQLNFAQVPIIEEKKCKRSYIVGIYPGMFCAGYLTSQADSCQGDSGGPLACKGTTLVGIVSWGAGCAQKNSPGVYTDVSYYLKWIENEKLRSSSNIKLVSIFTVINTAIILMLNYIFTAN